MHLHQLLAAVLIAAATATAIAVVVATIVAAIAPQLASQQRYKVQYVAPVAGQPLEEATEEEQAAGKQRGAAARSLSYS